MSGENGGHNACRLCCLCQSGDDGQNGPCAAHSGFSVGDRKLDWLVSVAVKHCQEFGMKLILNDLWSLCFNILRQHIL